MNHSKVIMSSKTTHGNVYSNSMENSSNCASESESDSSIEIHQNEEDSDSDADIIINSREMQLSREVTLPHQNVNLPSSSQMAVPTIGSISMQNSAHPMFGNKTFYKGKITINNYVSEGNDQEKSRKMETCAYESNDYLSSSTKIEGSFDQGERGTSVQPHK